MSTHLMVLALTMASCLCLEVQITKKLDLKDKDIGSGKDLAEVAPDTRSVETWVSYSPLLSQYQYKQQPQTSYYNYNYNYNNKNNNRRATVGSRSPSYDSGQQNSKWWCPPSYSIHPCVCDGPQGFILLTCDRLANSYSLDQALKAYFPSLDIGKLSITNSRIDQISKGDLGTLRYEYIYMKKNTLKSIDVAALTPSKPSLKRLEIINSDLEKFPFKSISTFPKLEYLDLHYNGLKSVPDFAFGTNSKLKEIDLSYNKIAYVGSSAFERVYNLEKLDLRFNKISVLNNDALALTRPNPKLNLDLSNNQMALLSKGALTNQFPAVLNLSCNAMKTFPEEHFKPVLTGMSLANSGKIDVFENRFRCSCTNIGWLVRCPDSIKRRVRGFYCYDLGKRLESLTLYDVNCPY